VGARFEGRSVHDLSNVPRFSPAVEYSVVRACVTAYAFSPIDLIPDFIPIFGYLDDLVLVPLGVALVVRMIPAALLDEHRTQAHEMAARGKPANWLAATAIVLVWLCGAAWLVKYFLWK
jgi:uncharacterized membrane protein YkvA (DUF1232 family)